MGKLGYFLGGVLAGAVALGAVAWYVSEHDSGGCDSNADDDDGCLRSAAAEEEEMPNEGAAPEPETAAQPA